MAVCSAIFADYWEYSRQYHGNPQIWMDVVQGTANAPQQYRVGVVKLADLLARHAHVGLRHAFTLLDLVSAGLAALLLYGLFERTAIYRRAGTAARWFGAAAFILLLQFYLSWLTWFQRPETLPTTLMLCGTLALASTTVPAPSHGRDTVLRGGGMLLLAALQGFIRADAIFAAHMGLLAACVWSSGGLALGRKLQAVISAISVAIAGGIQAYLMRVAYPHATYASGEVVEIRHNLTDVTGIAAFLLFMVPWLWAGYTVLRQRFRPEAADFGLLLGSAVYLAMWLTVGRIGEVRIFLPYAVTLIPVTAGCAMRSFAGAEG